MNEAALPDLLLCVEWRISTHNNWKLCALQSTAGAFARIALLLRALSLRFATMGMCKPRHEYGFRSPEQEKQ
jgi:hypothetical protein